jgi:hypothetical protein
MFNMAMLGMNMLGPPPNQFAQRQNPAIARQAQLMGVDYNTALRLFGITSE